MTTNSLPIDTWSLLNKQSHQTTQNWPFIADIYQYFFLFTIGNTCFGASSIITCSIMVFRFIAVKFPLKSNIYITYTKVKITIVIAFLVSFCTTLKIFVQFTVVEKVVNNATVKDVFLSKYATAMFNQITDITQISIILFIPFTVCCLFAILTVVAAKTHRPSMIHEKHSTSDKQRRLKESIITRMLLLVVFFYLLSCFSVGLRYVLRASLGRVRYYSYGVSMTIFDCVATNILLLNSSVNIILYSATNVTFRETFMAVFLCKIPSKERSVHNISNDTMNTSSTDLSYQT